MNKESLNEFYEADRFHKALRDRIDAHEPELSDSLWDRIEHDLNKREGKNRRVLAWVYVLSGMLLLSSGALYYLWNENQKLAENATVAPAVERLKPELKDASVSPSNTLEHSAAETQTQIASAENLGEALGTNSTSNRERNNAKAFQEYTPNLENWTYEKTAVVSVPSAQGKEETSANETAKTGEETEPTIDPILANLNGENAQQGEEPEMIGAEGKLDQEPNSGSGEEGNPLAGQMDEKSKNPKEPVAKSEVKIRPQFFIGLQGGFNSISQTALSGNREWLALIEKPMSFAEYGVNFGLKLNNGIYISSGVNSYSTGHAYTFDIVPTAPTPIPTPFPGADSIIAGDKYTLINRQNWIEVPMIVGYQYSLGKWSLNGEAGLSANLINSYSGSVPTPSYNKFDPDGTQNASPYKNFLNVRAGFGFGYQIFEGLQVSAMANWRQALTYSTNAPASEQWKASYAHRKPQSLGGQIRLTYFLK
ncbi:MAG: hypothetical protein EP332_12625 [Bacteroidetes bacterium]|nr:MAG: hypothetical protein EP332_12625 [Bacteroidota bacterium]